MNSDFSKAKVGDWAWHTRFGWREIIGLLLESRHPIILEDAGSFTLDGKIEATDVAPSIFIEPPACFNPEPKPCEFKKGDKVLVRDFNNTRWRRRYFAWENPKQLQEKFGTFADGADEWSSEGHVRYWKFCKPWTEGSEE